MTVEQAIKELKKLPKKAEIFLVKDWEDFDEEGYLKDLYRLKFITHQMVVVEKGMEFEDITEVLMEFEETLAGPIIEKDY
ncbi:MAG: hypothetical protein IKW83_12090 [Muribaculaceae bacterium]|nr:hypothetical protein [Muribaculaceae bacterium]